MPRMLKNEIVVFDDASKAKYEKEHDLSLEDSLKGCFHFGLIITKRMSVVWNLLNNNENFLKDLREAPLTLVRQLAVATDEMIVTFENKYPAGQSLKVRFSLNQLRTANAKITSKINEVKLDQSYDFDVARQMYLVQCGTLSNILKRLTMSIVDNRHLIRNENYDFAKAIMSLLKTTHVAYNGDLPDEMKLNVESINFSLNGKVVNSETESKVYCESEQALFNEECRKLKLTLDTMDLHRHHLDDVIVKARAVMEEINELKSKDINFDIKLATTIIRCTNTLLVDPSNVMNQKKYQQLANLTLGAPNIGKKTAGLMLGFLATVLIVSSVLLIMATAGYITLPLAIVATGVLATVSINMQAAAAGIGAGILVGSVGLFKRGMRHDLSKKMAVFRESNTTACKLQKTTNVLSPTI